MFFTLAFLIFSSLLFYRILISIYKYLCYFLDLFHKTLFKELKTFMLKMNTEVTRTILIFFKCLLLNSLIFLLLFCLLIVYVFPFALFLHSLFKKNIIQEILMALTVKEIIRITDIRKRNVRFTSTHITYLFSYERHTLQVPNYLKSLL